MSREGLQQPTDTIRSPKGNKTDLRSLAAFFLACLVFVALATLITSIWLSQTIFSTEYYKLLITRPGYLPLLRQAIEQDLQAQASFAGVPDKVLLAGLDNDAIHLQLRQYVVSLAGALNHPEQAPNAKTAQNTLNYPSKHFYDPLNTYLTAYNQSLSQSTTSDQLAAIQDVADQASKTVLTHIVLIDPTTVLSIGLVRQILSVLKKLALLTIPVATVLSILLALIIVLTIRDNREHKTYKLYRPSGGSHEVRIREKKQLKKRDPLIWTRAALNSVWFSSSLFLVPTLTLQATGLAGRLAIQTDYFRFAIETLATRANLILIIFSGLLFITSSIGLIALGHINSKS